MEQISLPFSLAILWSLIQHKQQGLCPSLGPFLTSSGFVSDWIDERSQTPRDYLVRKAHLLCPSSLLLLDHWVDSFHNEDDHLLPIIGEEQQGDTSPPIDVPEKVSALPPSISPL